MWNDWVAMSFTKKGNVEQNEFEVFKILDMPCLNTRKSDPIGLEMRFRSYWFINQYVGGYVPAENT